MTKLPQTPSEDELRVESQIKELLDKVSHRRTRIEETKDRY
jgi:hypothetical protein